MRTSISIAWLLVAATVLHPVFQELAEAERLCVRVTLPQSGHTAAVRTRISSGKCAPGFTTLLNTEVITGVTGATGVTGDTGPTGATGAQGDATPVNVYGDASAGSLHVTSSVSWASDPPSGFNLQFSDINIDPGVTLSVPSGTEIRTTGNFTNAGTLQVLASGAYGGQAGCRSEVASI
jgi:hypothetical protein